MQEQTDLMAEIADLCEHQWDLAQYDIVTEEGAPVADVLNARALLLQQQQAEQSKRPMPPIRVFLEPKKKRCDSFLLFYFVLSFARLSFIASSFHSVFRFLFYIPLLLSLFFIIIILFFEFLFILHFYYFFPTCVVLICSGGFSCGRSSVEVSGVQSSQSAPTLRPSHARARVLSREFTGGILSESIFIHFLSCYYFYFIFYFC
jgi:hypothetical protein